MQVEKKLGRGRTYRHIFFSLDDSLDFVADDVLIQTIHSFRESVEVLQQEGVAEEDKRYLRDMRRALDEMKIEARRRGLDLPEDTRLDRLASPS